MRTLSPDQRSSQGSRSPPSPPPKSSSPVDFIALQSASLNEAVEALDLCYASMRASLWGPDGMLAKREK